MQSFITIILFIVLSGSMTLPAAEVHASSSGGSADTESSTEASTEADNGSTAYPSYRLVGFMEQQFTRDDQSDDPAAFQIYRARFGLAGSVTDRISLNVVAGAVEPPDRTPRLVNAVVDFDIHPMLQLRTGQFLVPFGLEGPEPIFFNPAIERSTAIRRMNTFSMFRDIGIQASGSHNRFSYAAALVNGSGANRPAWSEPSHLVGRIGYTVRDNLTLGGSVHYGDHHYEAVPEDRSTGEYDRIQFGTDLTWRINALLLRGEYIYRHDELPAPDGQSTYGWNQHGGYLLAGYDITDNWQGILRFEAHQPDTGGDFEDNGFSTLTAGVNYYLDRQTRLSVNYEIRDDRRPGFDPGNLLTVQMQLVL